MNDLTLARAVERFAGVTHSVADVDLDRPWAWGAYDREGVRFAFFRTYEQLRELAAELAFERSAHGTPLSSTQHILAQYHGAYRDLQAVCLGVTAEEADRAPAEEEWSPKQTLAHIVGAEISFLAVVTYALERHRAANGRPAKIPPQAWEAFVAEASFDEALVKGPFDGILAFYAQWHERVLRDLVGIQEEELARPSAYWEDYEMSLRFRLHRFDSHLRQHTIQIEKALEQVGPPLNEARRLLRLIFAALAEAEGATIGAWDWGTERRRDTARRIAARANEIADILN